MSIKGSLDFLVKWYPWPTVLEIRCAWCGDTLGYKNGKGQSGISHGICDTCLAITRKEELHE